VNVHAHLYAFLNNLVASVIAGLFLYLISRGLGVWIALTLAALTFLAGILYRVFRPLHTVYQCAKPPMKQQGGALVPDSSARSPTVWHVTKEMSERSPSPCLYGPYRTLRRGTYLVDFRLKLGEEPPDQGAFYCDIACSRGAAVPKYLAGGPVRLTSANRYEEVTVRFSVDEDTEGAFFEWRIGRILTKQPGGELWADTITLTRL